MYRPVYTRQFRKDVKRGQRQGHDIEQFELIARTLLAGRLPDPIFRDHRIVGNYRGRRECHVESDWLLINKVEDDRVIFEGIGPHAELFAE